MPEDIVTLKLSKRAHDALLGLKHPDEKLEEFILRLTTAARASGFFGQGVSTTFWEAETGGKPG